VHCARSKPIFGCCEIWRSGHKATARR